MNAPKRLVALFLSVVAAALCGALACSTGRGAGDSASLAPIAHETAASQLLTPPTRPTITPPAPPASPAQVGQIPGHGGVGPDGTFSYTIPIEVPAGRGGMQPDLALAYSSRGGNGLVGLGWSLKGTSTITRCERLPASGGLRRRVEFAADDQFCLDGERLVFVGGTPNTTTAEYRTETDPFARIKVTEVNGVSAGEPVTWTVERKDKRIATYSWDLDNPAQRRVRGADGSVMSSSAVIPSWPLRVVQDRSGNSTYWSYDNVNYEVSGADAVLVPSAIEYTLCEAVPCDFGTEGSRLVEFEYEDRPSGDVIDRFVNGVREQLPRRLLRIVVSIKNGSSRVPQRTYQLHYMQSQNTGRSLVDRVSLLDTAGVAAQDLVFGWKQTSPTGYVKQTASSGNGFSYSGSLTNSLTIDTMELGVLDIDGDGNDDIALHEGATERILFGDGSGFFSGKQSVLWTHSGSPPCKWGHMAAALPVDLDRNGRTELVMQCGEAGYRVVAYDKALSFVMEADLPGLNGRPEPWWAGFSQSQPGTPAEGLLKFADLDGDGLPEMLYGDASTGAVWSAAKASYLFRSGVAPNVSYDNGHASFLFANGPSLSTQTGPVPDQVTTVTDQDGDGHYELTQADYFESMRSWSWQELPTMVYARRSDLDNVVSGPSSYAEGTNPGLGAGAFLGSITPTSPWYFVDVNGDGLQDALYRTASYTDTDPKWYLRINTGAGYLPASQITGDAGVALFYYKSDLHFDPSAGLDGKGRDNGLRVADMNGDGRQDLVLLDPHGGGGSHPSGFLTDDHPARIMLSNGAGFDPPIEMPTYGGGMVRLYRPLTDGNPQWPMSVIADLDGNGLMDLVEMVGDATSQRKLVTLSIPAAGGIDLLTTVGLATSSSTIVNLQTITYDSLSSGARAGDVTHTPGGEETFPLVSTSHGTVVKTWIANDGNGEGRPLQQVFHYSAAKADLSGRGFLGFTTVQIKDLITGGVTTNTYDLTSVVAGPNGSYRFYPRLGKPTVTTGSLPGTGTGHVTDLADATGTVVFPMSTWNANFAGFPLYMTDETRQSFLDGANSATSSNTKVQTTYDSYGNPKVVTTTVTDNTQLSGSTAPRVYTTTVTTSFDNLESSWRLGEARNVVTTRSADAAADSLQNGTARSSTRQIDYTWDGLGRVVFEFENVSPNPRYHRTEYGSGGVVAKRTTLVATTACGAPSDCPSGYACLPTGAANACFSPKETNYLYDASGAFIEAVVNPLGQASWKLVDPDRAWVYAEVDPNGVATLVTHDGFGRTRESKKDTGERTTFSYGQQLTRSAEDGGATSTRFFDLLGRTEYETRSTFDGTSVVKHWNYDSLGNVSVTSYRGSASTEAVVSATRDTAATAGLSGTIIQSARYDAAGRVVSTNDGGGTTTFMAYPSPLGTTQTTDQAGLVTTTVSDLQRRVLRLTQTSSAGTPSVTDYRYNELGTLGSIKNEAGVIERFRYDPQGRLSTWMTGSTLSTAETSRVERVYDHNDDIVRETVNGVALTYKLDDIGRLIERANSTRTEVQTYEWDPVGGIGKPARAYTPDHEIDFTYNTKGQLSERREKLDGGATSLSFFYGYDAFGRVGLLRYPEGAGSGDTSAIAHTSRPGPLLVYSYQNGQLKTISEVSGATFWQATKRHVLGMPTETKSGALTTTWHYKDNTLRPDSMTTAGVTSGPVPTQTFSYYGNGTLSQRTSNDRVEDFQYDGSRRFLGNYHRKNNAGTSSLVNANFIYDPQGLKTVDTTLSTGSTDWPNADESYGYVSATDAKVRNGQLLTATIGSNPTRSFTYDLSGRVKDVKEGTALKRHYAWNSFSLPTLVQDFATGVTRTFSYDAYGARVRKTQDADNQVIYVGNLYEQRNLTALTTKESVYRVVADGQIVTELVHPWGVTTRSTHHRLNDEQGSPAYEVVVTTSTQLGFFPFGKQEGAAPAQNFSCLGYTGHRQDDDLGLVNMNGRVYDVTTKRFLTRDIVPDQALTTFGTQPYSYVGNNPTNLIDPSGFDGGYPGTVSSETARNDRSQHDQRDPAAAAAARAREIAQQGATAKLEYMNSLTPSERASLEQQQAIMDTADMLAQQMGFQNRDTIEGWLTDTPDLIPEFNDALENGWHFRFGPLEGRVGVTDPTTRTVTLSTRKAWVAAHELGHVFLNTYLNPAPDAAYGHTNRDAYEEGIGDMNMNLVGLGAPGAHYDQAMSLFRSELAGGTPVRSAIVRPAMMIGLDHMLETPSFYNSHKDYYPNELQESLFPGQK